MAIGTLHFRARHGAAFAEDAGQRVRIRGEVEWFATGTESEIDALVDAVGESWAQRVTPTSVALRFGNTVGRYAVGALGILDVCCGKWDEDKFGALLSDLTEVACALPFAADRSAGLSHAQSLAEQEAILLHSFLYLRRIVLTAGRGASLRTAIATIVNDPHRRFVTERRFVGLTEVRRTDARSLERIVRGAEPMERAKGDHAAGSLARSLRGHLPLRVDVPHVFDSLDTAENRFVLATLRGMTDLVARVEAIGREYSSHFWQRVVVDCVSMRRVLEPLLQHSLWNDVGPATGVPAGSTVLQRRRGYRDVLRYHLHLRAAARWPLDGGQRELLGMRDAAALYELWCFFHVVRTMEALIGRRADRADRTRADHLKATVREGFCVAWSGEVAIHYNLTFTRDKEGSRRSVSVELRPDIVIEVVRPGESILHVLDAKLRLDSLEDRSYKNDDIAKMHAYRDALPAVQTAFVLYPGTETESFGDEAEGGIVGAIPLVPGEPDTALKAHLQSMLRRSS